MQTGNGIARRFTEERLRLGFSRKNLAHLIGHSAEGLRQIESGRGDMKARALGAAAAVGFDVQYVVTGTRSLNVDEVEAAASYAALGEQLATTGSD